jgi:hypothetical protein
MKKIGICGDSFMASISYDEKNDDNGYGKHFTEILAQKLNCELVTFARGACSNQAIRLQIDEVIKEKPDCVIIGLTSSDRIEIPIKNTKTTEYYKKITNKFISESFNCDDGLYNIDYRNYPDNSSKHKNFNLIEPKLISETINNFFNEEYKHKDVSQEDILLIEKWFNRLYDYKWKKQQDIWIISDGLRKLKEININFYCINTMFEVNSFDFCKENMIQPGSILNPWLYLEKILKVPYRFHTTLESQRILAENWFNFLNEKIYE